MSKRQYFFLIAFLLLGAALRVAYHDVPSYSRADEFVYTKYACRLAEHGLGEWPQLTREFNANPAAQQFPPPFRWGFVLPAAAAFFVTKSCAMPVLGWVSTSFGMLALLGTFLVANRLLGVTAALIATAFSVTSTLQLAMGRRALSDETFCAASLFAIWLLLRAVQAEKPRLSAYAAAVAALTWCFAIKETFLLVLPALAVAIAIERGLRRPLWRDALLLALPPLLAVVVFMLLNHGTSEFFSAWAKGHATIGQEYALRYQAGPWQRLLVDLLALSPVVMVLTIMALGYGLFRPELGSRPKQLFVLLVLIIAAFGVAPAKNARFVILADPLARMVAAWAIAERARTMPRFGGALTGLAVALNAASEFSIFNAVFIVSAVYDPVSDNLFRALHIIP